MKINKLFENEIIKGKEILKKFLKFTPEDLGRLENTFKHSLNSHKQILLLKLSIIYLGLFSRPISEKNTKLGLFFGLLLGFFQGGRKYPPLTLEKFLKLADKFMAKNGIVYTLKINNNKKNISKVFFNYKGYFKNLNIKILLSNKSDELILFDALHEFGHILFFVYYFKKFNKVCKKLKLSDDVVIFLEEMMVNILVLIYLKKHNVSLSKRQLYRYFLYVFKNLKTYKLN